MVIQIDAKKRKALYNVAIAVGVLLMAFGFVTADDMNKLNETLAIISGLVLSLTNLLATVNVQPDTPTE